MTESAAIRSLRLPEFNRLSVRDVLAVRDAAQKALPAFRTRVRQELFSLSDVSDEGEEAKARKAVNALPLEARQLEGQLAAISLPQSRRREKRYTSLAFALQVVALSTANPARMVAAGGTFANLLMNAHKSKVDRDEKHEALVHQPAYVLLTARRVHARH